MNPNVVAGLVNRAYPDFDMFSFDNRLKLQKFVYIMEYMFGLNLGYSFDWYHYGPYCSQLAKDGFGVDFGESPKVKFGDEVSEEKFVEFLEFIDDKDNGWLEIVSSIHFLQKIGYNKKSTIDTIKGKREEMNGEEKIILKIYGELEGGGKLNG